MKQVQKPLLTILANARVFLIIGTLIGNSLGAEPADHAQKGDLLRRMVLVLAGEFAMGTDKDKAKPLSAAYGFRKPPYENEEPMRKVFVNAFYIDRFEVTNIEYRKFMAATLTELPERWKDPNAKLWDMYPVTNVSWMDAKRYCNWKGARLPTEAEWEKAARGTDGRVFPWGNDYDEKKANTQQKGVAPIGSFGGDVSPYGVLDMGGNVSEWVENWYQAYPGNESDDPDYGETHRVVRGGSWGGVGHYNLSYYARAAYRGLADPEENFNTVGFRCAFSTDTKN